jgi:SAM-dependent methyltransferase
LSLGCGAGDLERGAFGLGICESFDAYDIAPEAIRTARDQAFQAGYGDRVRYICADLNKIEFPKEQFDICFGASALHHTKELERLIDQIHHALRPNGYFVIIEYVGPSRFQWSDKVNMLINKLLSVLPESHRLSLRDGKTIKGSIRRSTVEEVAQVDPSEAIRSDEILDLVERRFEILYRAEFGGTLLQFALSDIVGNFVPSDPRDNAILDLALLFEETLIQEKIIPNDFIFMVARPRPVPSFRPLITLQRAAKWVLSVIPRSWNRAGSSKRAIDGEILLDLQPAGIPDARLIKEDGQDT